MSDDLNVKATSRNVFGKGASRRLRRDNLVPAILYGGGEEPEPILLKHNEIQKHLSNDAFYSSLIMVSVDGGDAARTILRDVQRHPYRQQIMHVDFQRVTAGAELTLTVPLQFIGEEDSPGVKNDNGIATHAENEVAVACRPRDIPEFIEVDMSALNIGDSVTLSMLTMPEGVRLTDLKEAGDDSDRVVGAVIAPRVEIEETDDVEDPGDVPTTSEDDGADDNGDDGDKPQD